MKNKNIILIIIIIILVISNTLTAYFFFKNNQDNQTNTASLEEKIEALSKKNTIYEEALATLQGNNNQATDDTSDENQTYSHIIKLTYNQFQNKITNQDNFILVITQTYCSHCQDYKPVLNNVLEENSLIAYEIDLLELSDDEKTNFYDAINISGTPTTVFINNGKEDLESRLIGNVSESTILNKLKELKIIG